METTGATDAPRRKNHPMHRKPTATFRLTPTGRRLIKQVAEELGINDTDVVEMGVRCVAKLHGITVTPESQDNGEDGHRLSA